MSDQRWRGLLVHWRDGDRHRGLVLPDGAPCVGATYDDLRAQAEAAIADGMPHHSIRERVDERWLTIDLPLKRGKAPRTRGRTPFATPVAAVRAGILTRPGGGGWVVIPALRAWDTLDADRDPQGECLGLLARVLGNAGIPQWLNFGGFGTPGGAGAVGEAAVAVIRCDLRRPKPRDQDDGIPATLADAVTDHPLAREPLFARADEVARLVKALADRRSLVLVGPRGCGKTGVLLAALREAKLADRTWWSSANRLMAGTRWLGDWQERIIGLARTLEVRDGLLAMESLADCAALGAPGGEGATGLGACLGDLVRRGQLRLLCEATPEEFAGVRRRLPALAAALRPFALESLDALHLAEAISQAADHVGRARRQRFAPGVGARIEDLRRSRLSETASPGWTIRVLRDLARAHEDDATIGAAAALRAVAALTGVAERFLDDAEPLARAEVEEQLRAGVIGQDEAVRAAAGTVVAFKAGMVDPRRPLRSLLLLGPTGTGKTSLAKGLADLLLPHAPAAERLLRLDMSEFAGADCVQRLIGDGAEPGVLVRRVRERPVSVVLFDEIEKAHPRLRDVLMGVLDEGRLGDAFGRVVSFRSSVVVMTTNLGADAPPPVGFGAEPVADARAALIEWRPEFLNRIDHIVVFRPLDHAAMQRIVARELALLAGLPGLAAARLSLAWDDAAVAELARRGYDPRLGARPVQRLIRAEIAAPLARGMQTRTRPPRPDGQPREVRVVGGGHGRITLEWA